MLGQPAASHQDVGQSVVMVVLGLYVCFRHEGDFKEGAPWKRQYKICPNEIRTRDPGITSPTLYHMSGCPVPPCRTVKTVSM